MSVIFNNVAPDYGPRGTQTLADFDPYAEQGWFAHADRAMANGLYATLQGLGAAVGLAAGGIIRGGEAAVGADPELSDKWFDLFARPHVDALERVDADAASYGMASQVLHGLFRYGSEALLGGPAGVLALESAPGAAVEVQKGKDAATALQLGVTRGGTAALAVALPFTLPVKAGFGPAVLQRLGYGISSNTVLGISSRAVERDVLLAAGYPGEAPEVLDPRAMLVDTVLGGFFGFAGHLGAKYRARGMTTPSPELVDAAMTENLHLRDEDAAPKAPRTPAEMVAHTERMADTLDNLADGAVHQKDGSWVPRDSVDTVDAMPAEAPEEITLEQRMADLEAQLEREAIQAEGVEPLPPEVALLDKTAKEIPADVLVENEAGELVPAREWLGEQRGEVARAADPRSTLDKIVACASRSGREG